MGANLDLCYTLFVCGRNHQGKEKVYGQVYRNTRARACAAASKVGRGPLHAKVSVHISSIRSGGTGTDCQPSWSVW